METDKFAPRISLGENSRRQIATQLSLLLADSYGLYLKTQNFHWNINGEQFAALHQLFQTQYEELATAIDEIAERIRVLGFFVDGSLSNFAKTSKVSIPPKPPTAKAMAASLAQDHEALAEKSRNLWKLAGDNGDSATEALGGDRTSVHEKTAWMLRSQAA